MEIDDMLMKSIKHNENLWKSTTINENPCKSMHNHWASQKIKEHQWQSININDTINATSIGITDNQYKSVKSMTAQLLDSRPKHLRRRYTESPRVLSSKLEAACLCRGPALKNWRIVMPPREETQCCRRLTCTHLNIQTSILWEVGGRGGSH